jgi:competence protein ComEA
MNPDSHPFLGWLGYSRRERRSTLILFIILGIVIALRYILPQKEIPVEDLSSLLTASGKLSDSLSNRNQGSSSLFTFDPNIASFDTLTTLGFSARQAGTIINYRTKGGKFSKPGDIRKIYGIGETTATRLIPYIKLDKVGIRRNSDEPGGRNAKQEKLELNRCDSSDLERLQGIGTVLSSRIVRYRNLLGGFASVDQLKEVYGLPESTFSKIRGRVTADSTLIKGININLAAYKELSRHPYLERYDIQAILKYREMKGRIDNIQELVDNKILTEIKALRIKPYLVFD